MRRRLLVTGGAGYVGSHCARALVAAGHEIVTLDTLHAGHVEAVSGSLVRTDLRDRDRLHALLATGFDAVLHFAARMSVAESAADPLGYYDTNVGGTLHLLDAMAAAGCRRLVFSSTCAVYGVPPTVPISEDAPFAPISVYGETKAVVERLLAHLRASDRLDVACLRYFNAAGAAADGWLGEAHDPETHLIPLALDAATTGRPLSILGDRHDTPDGTCVRDYVHVEDLADVHALVLDRLLDGDRGGAWNVGCGEGASVLDVLRTVEQVTGRPVPTRMAAARVGDPPALIADPRHTATTLGWSPQRDLTTIIRDAWRWHQHPRYGGAAR